MRSLTSDAVDLTRSGDIRGGEFCVGQIVQITSQGKPLVDFPGNPLGPVEARVACATPPNLWKVGSQQEGIPALLMFDNGNADRPIVLGILRDTLESTPQTQEAEFEAEGPCRARVDGKKIVFDAKEEILLTCGKSSITLRKDGKIVVKGTHLVSRASRANRIKGGAVAIN